MKRFFMAGPWTKVTASNGVDTGGLLSAYRMVGDSEAY